MKHSQFDSFSYNDFTKEELFEMLVDVQEELIKTKKEHINDVRTLVLEKNKNKSLEIEKRIFKEKEIRLKKKQKKKPIADFKEKRDFNKSKGIQKPKMPTHKIMSKMKTIEKGEDHYFHSTCYSHFDNFEG